MKKKNMYQKNNKNKATAADTSEKRRNRFASLHRF
jgi:hypothetical protein